MWLQGVRERGSLCSELLVQQTRPGLLIPVGSEEHYAGFRDQDVAEAALQAGKMLPEVTPSSAGAAHSCPLVPQVRDSLLLPQLSRGDAAL